jgi:hypothetical protein
MNFPPSLVEVSAGCPSEVATAEMFVSGDWPRVFAIANPRATNPVQN